MKIAIIGAGLQGKRRVTAAKKCRDVEISVVASRTFEHAVALSEIAGCQATTDWEAAISAKGVDAVIICTPTGLHSRMCLHAIDSGKHILVEKPMTSTLADSLEMTERAKKKGITLSVGFNHRFHPGIRDAYERVKQGIIGEIIFLRSIYGICGRPGYEKEWRADPHLSGGGHLLEQGIHSIDLFRLFAGGFKSVTAACSTLYWNMPVEDNAMAIFRTAKGQLASLHASLTQWKNTFLFEVFGTKGYMIVEGLGGSYGVETLKQGIMDFSKPFETTLTEYRGEDVSWVREWESFVDAVNGRPSMIGTPQDGYDALRSVLLCYESSSKGGEIIF